MDTSNPWLFDAEELNSTPSIRDGFTLAHERMLRTEGARFIQKVGATEMNLHHITVATGIVFFHRFYMCQSFKKFPIYPMAATCLFLAGKAEETPKKSNDIVKVCRKVLSDTDFAAFTANSPEAKEEILILERILLQTLRFDLEVKHPFKPLLSYHPHLRIERDGKEVDPIVRTELIQSTWAFLNDSGCTTICLQYEPEIIAMGMLLLACKIQKLTVVDWDNRRPSHKNWWDVYVENLDEATLEDICHYLLDLYQISQTQSFSRSPQ